MKSFYLKPAIQDFIANPEKWMDENINLDTARHEMNTIYPALRIMAKDILNNGKARLLFDEQVPMAILCLICVRLGLVNNMLTRDYFLKYIKVIGKLALHETTDDL